MPSLDSHGQAAPARMKMMPMMMSHFAITGHRDNPASNFRIPILQLIGAGYALPFARHLSARVAADMFFNVKVTDPITAGGTIPETLIKFALGVDYAF
jgi:hypothetical protein